MTKQKPSLQDGNLTFAQKAEVVRYHIAHPELKQDAILGEKQQGLKQTSIRTFFVQK